MNTQTAVTELMDTAYAQFGGRQPESGAIGLRVRISPRNTQNGENMNNKTFNKKAIRHGEVMITPIEALPDGVEQIYAGREYIVGHSETRHHHVAVADIGGTITMFRPVGADDSTLFMRVSKDSRIEHRKTFDSHETKVLFKGLYTVTIKKAYDYFKKAMTKVMD